MNDNLRLKNVCRTIYAMFFIISFLSVYAYVYTYVFFIENFMQFAAVDGHFPFLGLSYLLKVNF